VLICPRASGLSEAEARAFASFATRRHGPIRRIICRPLGPARKGRTSGGVLDDLFGVPHDAKRARRMSWRQALGRGGPGCELKLMEDL